MKSQVQSELAERYEQEYINRLRKLKNRKKQYMKFLDHLDPDLLQNTHLKKLTLLHSNDLHGDFLAEKVDSELIGGVSMLSGYINKVRNEEPNVIYAIAGDMFRGSIIDSEFKGISTINIMNLLAPDVVTVGNHEVDYGLTHLLFLERCAGFPIINANIYEKLNGSRLFRSHIILATGGLKILFIGVLTREALSSTKTEELYGPLVDIKEAAEEIRKVTDAYKTSDIDMTVLLTHIGFEEDKKLAEELAPCCDIDIIIGGHSHTTIEEPFVVGGIPIVQAAVGTDQIGRFDIVFDESRKRIESYSWKLIPITEEYCPRDTALEEVIENYKQVTDAKYQRILTRFVREYTHPRRDMETELGDLIAQCIRSQLDVDLVLIGSGSIRAESLGPIVTLEDFMEAFPYHDSMIGLNLSGALLRKIMVYLMREDAFDETVYSEWFQFSDGFFCEYDRGACKIIKLAINGRDVQDEELYNVAVQSHFFCSLEQFFGISLEEAEENGDPSELASSAQNVLIEFFDAHNHIKLDEEQRLLIHNPK